MNRTIRTLALGLLAATMAGAPALAADKSSSGCPRGYDCPNPNCPYAQAGSAQQSQNPQTQPSQDQKKGQNVQARRERKRDGTGNGPRQERRRDGSCLQG